MEVKFFLMIFPKFLDSPNVILLCYQHKISFFLIIHWLISILISPFLMIMHLFISFLMYIIHLLTKYLLLMLLNELLYIHFPRLHNQILILFHFFFLNDYLAFINYCKFILEIRDLDFIYSLYINVFLYIKIYIYIIYFILFIY